MLKLVDMPWKGAAMGLMLSAAFALGACSPEEANNAADDIEDATENLADDVEDTVDDLSGEVEDTVEDLTDDGDTGRNRAVVEAVNNPNRAEVDTSLDEARKPAEVLSFVGPAPGMTILDVNAGGGYYTEILSYVVGDEGKVYSYNDEVYWPFVEANIAPRYADDRLPNVDVIHGPIAELAVPEASVDMAIMVLAYHDWYFINGARTEAADVPAALTAIKSKLKPGGTFTVIDHVAEAGSPPEVGNTLHRIDPGLVKTQMADAGFEFIAESDILSNDEDDHTLLVFDETVRRKTDRFIFVFQKPEE